VSRKSKNPQIAEAPKGGSSWSIELCRPVVHEIRRDGVQIIHIRPRGGKSRLMGGLLTELANKDDSK
jgi:hypothetical protein